MLRAGTWSGVHVEVSSLGSLSRPSRHRRRRREDEGEGRGGEQRSALGTAAAVRSAPAPPPAVPRSGAGVKPPWLARGGEGGSLQHLPLLPLPAAQIKKQQKATNHPRAERGAAGGGRSVRRRDSAGGAHGWARAGLGWDAGPGFGRQGSAALLARLGRLLSLPSPPLLPPVPPPLHPRSGSAASAAATAAARPPGQEL